MRRFAPLPPLTLPTVAVAVLVLLLTGCTGSGKQDAKNNEGKIAHTDSGAVNEDTSFVEDTPPDSVPPSHKGDEKPKETGKTIATTTTATHKHTATDKKHEHKTVAEKQNTAKTTPATHTPAKDNTPATPAQPDPYSLVEQGQNTFVTLPTFSNDLEDMTVALKNLSPWAAKPSEYSGQYLGPLGAEVSNVKVAGGPGRKLVLDFGYQAEVVSDDGSIDYKDGDAVVANPKLATSLATWPKPAKLNRTEGQFVKWTAGGKTEYGFLTRGINKNKAEYTLLRKAKG